MVSKYGEIGYGSECLNHRGEFTKGSYWWIDRGKITNSTPFGPRNWFNGNIDRQIGNGSNTLFWHHVWVGNYPLCYVFPRLYNASLDNDKSVAEMGRWINQSWDWTMNWRRELFEWELELLNSLQATIANVKICQNSEDSWSWKLENSEKYSARSAYAALSEIDSQPENELFKIIWCNKAPLKLTSFSWKVILDRIQTRIKLLSRHIIPLMSSTLCPPATTMKRQRITSCFLATFPIFFGQNVTNGGASQLQCPD